MRQLGRVPYFQITDGPGLPATAEQVQRILQRYRFAKDRIAGHDVLDVACGTGMGSGYLSSAARSVVAGDIDPTNIEIAKHSCAHLANASTVRLDAQSLPFRDASFDSVLLFEVLYHLADPGAFIREAARVLRPGGWLFISAVNKDWHDLHPSPHAVKYYSVPELASLVTSEFSAVQVLGGMPVGAVSIGAAIFSVCKKAVVVSGLMPKTLGGRSALKRLVYGRLAPLPALLDDKLAEYSAPSPIPAAVSCRDFKVLYSTGRKPNARPSAVCAPAPAGASTIVILTSNNLYSLLSLSRFLRAAAPQIPLIVITKRLRRESSNLKTLLRMWRASGAGYAAFKLLTNLFCPIIFRLCGFPVSVTAAFRLMGFRPRVVCCRNANSSQVRDAIASCAPDILIGAGCTTILSPEILELPNKATLNLHPSLLPLYPGTAPTFWALANGDRAGGATVHLMVPKVDAGPILYQRRMDLRNVRSMFHHMLIAADLNGEMLLTALGSNFDTSIARPQDLSERRYCGHPSRSDVRRFTDSGKRFWAWRDLVDMFTAVRRLRGVLRRRSWPGDRLVAGEMRNSSSG